MSYDNLRQTDRQGVPHLTENFGTTPTTQRIFRQLTEASGDGYSGQPRTFLQDARYVAQVTAGAAAVAYEIGAETASVLSEIIFADI